MARSSSWAWALLLALLARRGGTGGWGAVGVGLGGEVDVRAGEFGMLASDDAAEAPGGALGGRDRGAFARLRCFELLSASGDEPELRGCGLNGACGGVDRVDDVFGDLEGVG